MKFLTNKGVVQKTVIAILIVILTTFITPTTVQADWGGKLLSPIFTFITAIFDGVQHLLEMAMLGETEGFMKDIHDSDLYNLPGTPGGTIETDEEIDGSFFGIDAVNVPMIRYTPEAIFQNQVPALDINFINPSVDGDDERNTAKQLRGAISSWYLALRSIAVVGLLSVLIYLGIRMLMTSVAADKAKYKQMLMDWLIAMCLVLVLHYIMSFALTMAETITAMVSSDDNQTIRVIATNVDPHWWSGGGTLEFSTNLMGYVRFMVQAEDINVKIAFFALYVMLVIYSVRFTWVYLKRVVNMAFLTLIAPMVALTYPIDKVGDGKAQAFNIWLKEYTYNALIQPVHLLLYKVLLGTAIELAAKNPLYAIVSLGFIIAAEKLVKKMFGFDKASGGTVGSLAAAAGVTTMAGKMLNSAGKAGPSGGNGKIRTKDSPERTGKDDGANKPFRAFQGRDAGDVIGANSPQGNRLPPPDGGNNNELQPPREEEEHYGSKELSPEEQEKWRQYEQQREREDLEQQLADYDETDPYFLDPEHQDLQRRYQDLREQENQLPEQEEGTDSSDEVPPPPEEDKPEDNTPKQEGPLGFRDTVKQDVANFGKISQSRLNDVKNTFGTQEGRQALGNKIKDGARKRAIGAWKALPTVGYTAARGTLKTASKVALAAGMAAMGGIIGATTGDGEKALSMALGAGAIGFSTGGNIFESTAGQVMREKSVRDSYEAGKYGNKIDARNARADKNYFRSEKFDDFYEKFYKKQGYTKKQVQDFVQDYRKAGITNETEIRRAKALEEKYIKESQGKLSEKDAREQVQNIVQSYKDMDIDKKAYSDDKVKAKEISRIAGMLGGANDNNNKLAGQIFQGYEDWRNSAV